MFVKYRNKLFNMDVLTSVEKRELSIWGRRSHTLPYQLLSFATKYRNDRAFDAILEGIDLGSNLVDLTNLPEEEEGEEEEEEEYRTE